MKLDLNNQFDRNKAETYFKKLLDKRGQIELKEVKKSRTLRQNSYLHVVITLYAIHFGSTLNEAKTDLKRECQFMTYKNNDKRYLKETHKMDTKELTEFIEWIRTYSSQNGCYIPTSTEYLENKFNIDREIESNKQFL